MVAASGRRGFTWIELLVAILIIGILLLCLPLFLLDSRRDSHRGSCVNNMKQLGVALHNHENASKRFPASSTVPGGAGSSTVNGWSWLTFMLPFCEQQVLYDDLQVKKHPEGPSPTGTPLAYSTEVSAFVCPSYTGPKFRNARNRTGPLTQYKAIGATHIGSLEAAVAGGGSPGYPGNHPDGALYPGVKPKLASFVDGTSNTVVACETIEESAAVWCEGGTAALVGLPSPAQGGPTYTNTHGQGTYYAPTGYNGKYDEEGQTAKWLTYVSWDFEPPRRGDGPYIPASFERAFPWGSKDQIPAGPSSEHAKTVTHLFGDGTVHNISREIDAALYFFIITRANGDPGSEFHASEY